MKLTKTQLRGMIREELEFINESDTPIQTKKQLEIVIKNNAKAIAKGKMPVEFFSHRTGIYGRSN